MEKLVFRQANINDIEDILLLYEDAKKQAFCLWNDDYPTIKDIDNDVNNHNLYVLTKDEIVVGSISIVSENELNDLPNWATKDNAYEFARVVVNSKYQGNGYACFMIEEIEKIVCKKGGKAIHILAGIDNLPACKTYDKLDYKNIGKTLMFDNIYFMYEKVISKY